MTYTSPEQRERTTELDALGRVIRVTVPGLHPTEITYDDVNERPWRVVSVQTGARVTRFDYDARGAVSELSDEADGVPLATTALLRDAVDRVVTVTRPLLLSMAARPSASATTTRTT